MNGSTASRPTRRTAGRRSCCSAPPPATSNAGIGIALSGGHLNPTIVNNRFTTWPGDRFVVPSVLPQSQGGNAPPPAEFHPVDAGHLVSFVPPGQNTAINEYTRTYVVDYRRCSAEAPIRIQNSFPTGPTLETPLLAGNSLSQVPYDFGIGSLLAAKRTKSDLAATDRGLGDAWPVPAPPSGSYSPHPSLRIGRASLWLDANQKLWVHAIGIEASNSVSGAIQVRARIAREPGGSDHSLTTAIEDFASELELRVEADGVDYLVSGGTTTADGCYKTWSFSGPQAPNTVRLTVYRNLSLPDGTAFRPDNDLWSSVELAYGNVLAVEAYNDLADDKSLSRGKFALYRKSRTGTSADNVNPKIHILRQDLALSPAGNPDLRVARPASPVPSSGPTQPVNEYQLRCNNVTLTPKNLSVTTRTYDEYDLADAVPSGSFALPAANDAVVVEVVPVADSETEIHGVYLRLAEANPGAPFYCAKDRRYNRPWDALVKIYDGPEYTAVELGDLTFSLPGYPSYGGYRYPASTDSRDAFCLNNASPYPMIGGSAHYPNNVYGPEQHFEGYWSSGGYGSLNDITGQRSGTGFIQTLTGIGDTGELVGLNGNLGRCIRAGFNQTLDRTNYGSASLSNYLSAVPEGISPDGLRIPGWLRYGPGADDLQPSVWKIEGTNNLQNRIWRLQNQTWIVPEGKALAVNNAGVAVGWIRETVSGFQVKRAFRTTSTNASTQLAIYDADLLPPLSTQDDSVALAVVPPQPINARGIHDPNLDQLAVGRIFSEAAGATYAVFWSKRSASSAQATAIDLGFLKDENLLDFEHAEAVSVNRYGRIVGSSWSIQSGSPPTEVSRAFLCRGPVAKSMLDLNDPHFVRKDPTWRLERATAINDNNHIVCVGRNAAGAFRAYLLVPRTPGN